MQPPPFDLSAIQALAARLFPHAACPQVEQVPEGVSTYVYRICRDAEVFYLRVLPETGASFAPEVLAHRLLREREASVPEVISFEHCNETLGHSVMVTTEIRGQSLSSRADAQAQRRVLRAAGRDLAIINSLSVEGFGWIKRDQREVTRLEAEHPTSRAFLAEYLERDLATLKQAQALKPDDVAAIRRILARCHAWLDAQQAWLAHGDFDVTHIYQEEGRYTGIIDFGEIRGADRWYDLGHFRLHDGEHLPALVLPWLLEGYQEVIPPPDGYTQHIAFTSLLIAIRTLARAAEKRPAALRAHHALHAIPRDITILLAG